MYFLEPEKRRPPQLFFYRLIGWDEAGETVRFLHQYWQRASRSGLWLRQTLPNPTDNEINRFFAAVGNFAGAPAPQLVNRHVTIWLGQLRPERREALIRALNSALAALRDLSRAQSPAAADSVARNAYIKLMCWISALGAPVLRRAGGANPPKALYEGEITRHELLFLRVLALSGCDVVYVNFNSEQSYTRADPEGRFSQPLYGEKTGPPPTHYSDGAALRQQEARAAVRSDTDKVAGIVETNAWFTGDDFWEAALRENRFRRPGANPRLCNLCILCFGADRREEYRNRLFVFREKLSRSGKGWVLLDRKIPNPTNEEVAEFREAQQVKNRRGLEEAVASRLTVAGGETLALLARRALLALFGRQGEDNPGRFGNYAVKMACWLKRYADLLFADYRLEAQPLLLAYGPLLPAEIDLLWLLKEMGVDILYFSPDKAAKAAFRDHPLLREAKAIELPDSLRWEPFPDKEIRTRVATVAYNASRELDQTLYDGTGLFRPRQFPRAKPVTLKTTYDEIGILWKVEAKFRPNFQVTGETVVVPTIFAKVCGVENGDVEAYWDKVGDMAAENAFVIPRAPFFSRPGSLRLDQARAFLRNGRLDPRAVKTASSYAYSFLPENIQDAILEKIQELLDQNILRNVDESFPRLALAVLLGLERDILRLIQNFDYTKAIPKLVVVDTTEHMFSLEDCIHIAFLNLVGFDIVIFAPPGYRDIEHYIGEEFFETYQAGEYAYYLTAPNLRERKKPGETESLLGRLFGRRKNT
jgi:hypothetical protein